MNYQDCEFDIENEDVFSVERIRTLVKYRIFGGDEYLEQTVIGFYDKLCPNAPHAPKKRKSNSWYLDCSPEKHWEFVDRFRAKLKRQN